MLADVDLPGRATAREAAWSPDGTQYAYSQLTYEDELGVAVCDIWVSNADGSQRHRVTTTPGIDGEISWASP
jgi:Tol biopolymer transport system component